MIKSQIQMQDNEGNWRLPNEVLIRIVKLVEDRENLSMTSKKFYSIICCLEKNRKLMKFNIDKLENDEIFHSILNSERKADVIFVDTTKLKTLDQFWRFKTVFYKFGAFVENLTWESCKLTKDEVVTILNFMPNLRQLTASTWKMQQVLFNDNATNLDLHNLRRLKIKRSDHTATQFFADYLPNHILNEIILQGDPDNIFSTQITVKKVELNVDSFTPAFTGDEFGEIKLSHLKLKLRKYKDILDQSIINKILKQQTSLVHLDLVECEGCFDEDDESFNEICNLQILETLKVNIDCLSPTNFARNFYKLTNLTQLHIESVEHNFAPIASIVECMSRHEMNNLKTLKIYFNDFGIDVSEVGQMGLKFKNLENMWLRCDHPLPLDIYLGSFRNLKKLSIDYHYSKEFSKLCNNFDVKFPDIVDLSLHGFGFGSEDVNWNELTLLKLTEIVPNLRKFECDANFPFNTEYIFRIMEKMKKLESIKNWSMTQYGENYINFDGQSILDLKGIAGILKEFSIELKLRAIDMDLTKVKIQLSETFDVLMTRIGNYFVFRMEKQRHL